MQLRNALTTDAEALVELHHRAVHAVVHPAYPAAVLASWSPPTGPDRRAWMAERIADPANAVIVAEADGAIAGFVFAAPAAAWIRALYVDPRHARRGIGAALLAAAAARLRAAGSPRAGLNASLNAVGFYSARGYRAVEATTQLLGDGTRMECMAMEALLDPGTPPESCS